MVSADEVGRSLRGAAAFLNREPGALGAFEISVPAFWRSFGAVALTVPAYVVGLAMLRRGLGLSPSAALFDEPGLATLAALGHLAGFFALPAAMAMLAGRLGVGSGFVPFVIVTNWLAAFASFWLALPSALLLIGWETPALTHLFQVAFMAIVIFVQWNATRITLETDAPTSAAIVGLGLLLTQAAASLVQTMAWSLVGSPISG